MKEKHAEIVRELAKKVYSRDGMVSAWIIDVNPYGVWAPGSDPENITLFRDTVEELIEDTYAEIAEDY